MTTQTKETGATSTTSTQSASLLIELEDGVITVYHGEDNTALARKEKAHAGDWDKLISFLSSDTGLGCQWHYPL